MYVSYRRHSYWDLTFKNDRPFFYIALLLLLVVLAVSFIFMKSKIGKFLNAVNGDEDATESLGIETFKTKLYAFQLSAMLCSIACAIYASYLSYISPLSIAGLDLSIKIGVIAIVGGVGTLFGPVIGAFIVIPLIELTSVLLGSAGGSQLLYGLLLVIIVLFKPKGVISLFMHKKNTSTEEDVNKENNDKSKMEINDGK